jgi:FkbM family methyltransferase
MNIPIVIICHNNYKYVENTIKQIFNINKLYYNNIIILDNLSTETNTVSFLKNTTCKVIFNHQNAGPWVHANYNEHIYDQLPDTFILTDPDLEFNKKLPSNFIDHLVDISNKYRAPKVGFALDISDYDKMYNGVYYDGLTIYEWEQQYWKDKIDNSDYSLFYAATDTTFHLYNKKFVDFVSGEIRIAGDFTAKHLPWYINNPIINVYNTYKSGVNKFSTITKLSNQYIDTNFLKIKKNDELFLIKNNKDNVNIRFWTDHFTNWESDTFSVFDKCLMKDKVSIDIGAWIGTTGMYMSRKSKHVYCVEADTESFADLSTNLKNNCENNYTLFNNAIFNVDDIEVNFGKNKFLPSSKLNDSTSQIYDLNDERNDLYKIKTITVEKILKDNNISPNEICLIKVDIEGGEENILNELFDIHLKYKAPLYISFHYSWWRSQDLSRFSFLTDTQKNNIIRDPFTSILFNI